MANIGDLEFLPLQFDKNGGVVPPEQEQAIRKMVADNQVTDLFVVSHGWQNDAGTAIALYERLFANVSNILRARYNASRRAAVVGVFWPSKPRYKDYGSLTKGAVAVASGGAASAGGPAGQAVAIHERLEDFKLLFQADENREEIYARIDAAIAKAAQLDVSPEAQNAFVEDLRAVVSPQPTAPEEDRSDKLVGSETPGSQILQELKQPTLQARRTAPGTGGATSIGAGGAPTSGRGGAAGFGSSIGSAALKLIDQFSYYEMKERAGKVGQGLNPVLARLRGARPEMRIHLVGHSFGARLVTSAASGSTPFAPSSMTLLQAAFSHNAFSSDYNGRGDAGFFRSVIETNAVHGPIVITHTANDSAVGVAYPIASKLAGQQANSIGGPDDVFGGLGRNGAIKTREAKMLSMAAANGAYSFADATAKIYNLLADEYIQDRNGQDAHGDVTSPAVANVVASAAGY